MSGAPAARAAPQDLFGDRLTRERAGLQMWIELARKHAARDLHFAQVSDRGRVDPTAVFQHQVDHRRVRCVPCVANRRCMPQKSASPM